MPLQHGSLARRSAQTAQAQQLTSSNFILTLMRSEELAAALLETGVAVDGDRDLHRVLHPTSALATLPLRTRLPLKLARHEQTHHADLKDAAACAGCAAGSDLIG